MEQIAYGPGPSQFGEITRRANGAAARGTVVVIHGGFWQAQYDLSLGRPLATALAAAGWDVLNLEYRRVGDGGGFPATFDDVAAGIDALAKTDLPTDQVVTLGHSAGGHLAVWAASRGLEVPVAVTGAVSQAGVLDLVAADAAKLGNVAVRSLMGGPPEAAWAIADPAQQIPIPVPVRCVHGADDTIVPPEQSADYVRRAQAAGADATLTMVPGDHFAIIDPSTPAWAACVAALDELGSR